MADEIVVEDGQGMRKIAALVDGRLQEIIFYDETKANEGNVYLGKIIKKIATANGKKSYFVNIGTTEVFINAQERELEDLEANEGQDIILQISQEKRAEKNAKGVRFLQLAGEYVVFCPYGSEVAVSQKIDDEDKCEHLFNLVSENIECSGGWIVRTNAATADDTAIKSEMTKLQELFKDIIGKAKNAIAPALLYKRDCGLDEMLVRNADSLRKITVNNHILEQELTKYGDKVIYQTEPFKQYGIDEQIVEALSREVKLKSGGRIFIEETKALVAIDVDSGGSLEQGSIGRLNCEAAAEIARQIILRNLAGKIVIDFAGFSEYKFLKSAIDVLEQGLQADFAKSRVLGLSRGGNVEILRSRRHPSLSDVLMKECDVCHGYGRVEK